MKQFIALNSRNSDIVNLDYVSSCWKEASRDTDKQFFIIAITMGTNIKDADKILYNDIKTRDEDFEMIKNLLSKKMK